MSITEKLEQLTFTNESGINQQLAAFLREEIVCGYLKPGDKLPSLRKMAEILDTNYFSVQLATEALMHEGVLEKFTGKGIYVADRNSELRRVGIFITKHLPLSEYTYLDALLFFLHKNLEQHGIDYEIFQNARPLSEDHTPPQNLIDAINTGKIQALIPLGTTSVAKRWLERLPIRMVSLGPHKKNNIPAVDRNYASNFGEVAESLKQRQCRRIALIAPAMIECSGKNNWILRAFTDRGINIKMDLVRLIDLKTDDVSFDRHGYELTQQLLSKRLRPDALVVYPEHAARGATMAILERGIKVPDELYVAFHRNLELPYFCPFPVDYIDTSLEKMAENLFQKLLKNEK